MKMSLAALAAPVAFALSLCAAQAQQSPSPSNPLRGRPATTQATPAQAAPSQAAPAEATTTRRRARATTDDAEAAKPKRARSEAQLANDERMRKCGAEWRADKAKLTAQGKTWLTFSTECRARLKAQAR